MKILVCGGRDYRDADAVALVLEPLRERLAMIISSGAPGADALAWDWGWRNGVYCDRYVANWRLHGKAAGPIRNQRMIDEGKPDRVIAFPGGRGTADMIRRARAAGIPVQVIE